MDVGLARTVDKLIDDGIDGLITDYPDRLHTWLGERGFVLPRQYPAPRGRRSLILRDWR